MDRECYQKALGEEGMQLVKPSKFFSTTIILLACPHANLVYVAIFRSVSMSMGFASASSPKALDAILFTCAMNPCLMRCLTTLGAVR